MNNTLLIKPVYQLSEIVKKISSINEININNNKLDLFHHHNLPINVYVQKNQNIDLFYTLTDKEEILCGKISEIEMKKVLEAIKKKKKEKGEEIAAPSPNVNGPKM